MPTTGGPPAATSSTEAAINGPTAGGSGGVAATGGTHAAAIGGVSERGGFDSDSDQLGVPVITAQQQQVLLIVHPHLLMTRTQPLSALDDT